MQDQTCLAIAPTEEERLQLYKLSHKLGLSPVAATYYLHNATGPRTVGEAMQPSDGSYPENSMDSLPGRFLSSQANAVALVYYPDAYRGIGTVPVLLANIKRAYEASHNYGGTHTGRLAIYAVCGDKTLAETIPGETADKNTSAGKPLRHGSNSGRPGANKRIDMQDAEVVAMARMLGILKDDSGAIQKTAEAGGFDEFDFEFDEMRVPLAPLPWLPDHRVVEIFSQCDVYDVQQAGDTFTTTKLVLDGAEFRPASTTTL